MTAPVQPAINSSVANGVTLVFPYSFMISSANDLGVTVDGTSPTSSYTVSGVGDVSGGNVTFSMAPPNGAVVTLYRDPVLSRDADYQQFGDWLAENVNNDFDRLWLALQTHHAVSVRAPAGDPASGDMVLPSLAERKNMYLGFSADGRPGAYNPAVGGITDASNINYLPEGTGAVATSVQSKLRRFKVSTVDNGAVGGGADDTAAVNAAVTQVSGNGGVVYFPATASGLSGIASQITQPNRVRFEGENVRCSGLKARSGFSSSWMVNSANGVTSMFDAGFESMTLNANDIAGVGCILSDALQENSSLRRVLLTQFRTYGILFQNGYGGASSALIEGCEIFGSAVGAAFSGIFVEQISVVGGFKLTVRDTAVTGAPAAQLTRAIAFVNDSSDMSNVHFEEAAVGLYLDGVGHHTIVCMDGATTVTTLVELAATFTGSLTMIGCKRNGATNFIVDNRSGGIGTITGYDIEHLEIPGLLAEPSGIYAPNIHKAYAVFDGTGAGPYVPGTAACPGYFNISSIAKTGTGRWTVTLAKPVRNFGAMLVSANTSLPNATITVAPTGVTTFAVGINVAGVATDSNQVFCSCLCN